MKKNKLNSLRALSVAQPWATCIVSKGKNIENREWNTKFRGFIAIHASAKCDLERFEYLKQYKLKIDPRKLPYGAIVGIAEIVEVVTTRQLTPKTKNGFKENLVLF